MKQAKLIENLTFENIDYTGKIISKNEFYSCRFHRCNFSDCNLSHNTFIDCSFVDCNLSMLKIIGSSLKNVTFKGCKLIGVDFSECNDFLFKVDFENCILDYSYFLKKKMAKTTFKVCTIKDANFTDSDLTQAIFGQCDLSGTVFERTNLTGADFSSSYNFSIDPEANRIKNARFSQQGLSGLLQKYGIIIE
jgi:fluoroquinolone resistance protein